MNNILYKQVFLTGILLLSDIEKFRYKLGLMRKDNFELLRKQTTRNNIRYGFANVVTKQQKVEIVAKVKLRLQETDGRLGIIYCKSRNTCDYISIAFCIFKYYLLLLKIEKQENLEK
jgi:hypothetical protein